MCGLCGLLGVVHWTVMSAHRQAFTDSDAPTARSERIARGIDEPGIRASLRMFLDLAGRIKGREGRLTLGGVGFHG